MDCCPLKLWTEIAGHACTDGGYTGCSLSLVSRAMYKAVEPVRYHSVALTGNEQLIDFAARLGALRCPPVIRHLFIADLHVESTWQDKNRYLSRINQRLHSIILCSAPNVITLTIHDWNVNLAIDDLVFPCLHDLMLSRSNPPNVVGEEDMNLHFPALRRLCVLPPIIRPHDYPVLPTGIINPSQKLWLDLTGYASRITHLRLFDTNIDGYFLQFLRVLLNLPVEVDHYFNATDVREAHAVASQLSSLRYIFVQTERPRRHLMCSQCARSITDDVTTGLFAISDESKRGDGIASARLEVLPEFGWHQDYTLHNAYTDWRSAVEGTDGPWVGPTEVLEEPPSPVVRGRTVTRTPSRSPSLRTDESRFSPVVIYAPSRRSRSSSAVRSLPPFSQPDWSGQDDTDKLRARVAQLTSTLTSLHRSIALGNEVRRLGRRLASETSARDLCLSLQLITSNPTVREDLQRRVDQYDEAIATLECDLSEAERRLKEAEADVGGATIDLACSSSLEHAPDTAPHDWEAGPSGQGSHRLGDCVPPHDASSEWSGCRGIW